MPFIPSLASVILAISITITGWLLSTSGCTLAMECLMNPGKPTTNRPSRNDVCWWRLLERFPQASVWLPTPGLRLTSWQSTWVTRYWVRDNKYLSLVAGLFNILSPCMAGAGWKRPWTSPYVRGVYWYCVLLVLIHTTQKDSSCPPQMPYWLTFRHFLRAMSAQWDSC